jgi:hypothetical protein
MAKIISRIFGGLGNQLFMYATARALAQRTGAELVLDTHTGFKNDPFKRKFSLQGFNIQYKEANAFERFDFPTGKAIRYFLRRANQSLPFRSRFYLTERKEDERSFMPKLASHRAAALTWMEGYWQSPLYFEHIREELTQEITVESPLSRQTQKMAEAIRGCNSVCVHLRMLRNVIGGVETGANRKIDAQHYLESMDYLAQSVENPRFFCFSDNPKVLELFPSVPHDVVFVTHNKGDGHVHEDFHLMSLCRHFILSNSTFGWWPAWLNSNPDSIVIAPPLRYWDNRDILPSHWLTFDKITAYQTDAV